MRIAVTRPAEDAQPLAAALRDMGVEPVLEPLMFIENVSGVILNLGSYQALLITSANGVRALAACTTEQNIKVFAVGDASAQAAEKAGFQNVESAAGNVETLARLVVDHLTPADGPLLHVAGTRVAGDLAGQLSQEGFEVKREVLYRARFAEQLSPEFVRKIEAGDIDGVALFSPRTATAFIELAQKAGIITLDKVTAFCLSQAVADQAVGLSWRDFIVADSPDQGSLLHAIRSFENP
jgi:uroporphyrinogen-III synthase